MSSPKKVVPISPRSGNSSKSVNSITSGSQKLGVNFPANGVIDAEEVISPATPTLKPYQYINKAFKATRSLDNKLFNEFGCLFPYVPHLGYYIIPANSDKNLAISTSEESSALEACCLGGNRHASIKVFTSEHKVNLYTYEKWRCKPYITVFDHSRSQIIGHVEFKRGGCCGEKYIPTLFDGLNNKTYSLTPPIGHSFRNLVQKPVALAIKDHSTGSYLGDPAKFGFTYGPQSFSLPGFCSCGENLQLYELKTPNDLINNEIGALLLGFIFIYDNNFLKRKCCENFSLPCCFIPAF